MCPRAHLAAPQGTWLQMQSTTRKAEVQTEQLWLQLVLTFRLQHHVYAGEEEPAPASLWAVEPQSSQKGQLTPGQEVL